MDYLDKIINDTEGFFYVDDNRAFELSAELSEHMRNKLYFNPEPLKVNKGINITEDFSTKNLRQSFFNDCTIEGANYFDAGLAGSLFYNTIFGESNYTNTNFQSCDFRGCNFNNIKDGFKYTRFSKSIFTNSLFENCYFKGALMNDVIFTNCTFRDCQWTPISIENAVFKHTTLDKVKFRNMNFEFSTFDDIKLNEVKLPFPTIPYIYNGLTYLCNTSDRVRVTSAKSKQGISIDEYLSNIDKLVEFYKYTNNYFPLTNILICKKMYEEAFASILKGITLAIELRRFRMLKNYCKQLKYVNKITMHERQILYSFILKKTSNMDFKVFEQQNLNSYLPEIRELLLKDVASEKLEISISTNIDCRNIQKLSVLVEIIDLLLGNNCNYSIELRHNSPWDVFISIFADPENISLILSGISLVFVTIQTSVALKEYRNNKEIDDEKCTEKIIHCKNKLKDNNIVIVNLTINNNGNIQINNISKE